MKLPFLGVGTSGPPAPGRPAASRTKQRLLLLLLPPLGWALYVIYGRLVPPAPPPSLTGPTAELQGGGPPSGPPGPMAGGPSVPSGPSPPSGSLPPGGAPPTPGPPSGPGLPSPPPGPLSAGPSAPSGPGPRAERPSTPLRAGPSLPVQPQALADPFRGGRDPALDQLEQRLRALEAQLKLKEAENKLKEQEVKRAQLQAALKKALTEGEAGAQPAPGPGVPGSPIGPGLMGGPWPGQAVPTEAAPPPPLPRVLLVSLGAEPEALVELDGARFVVRAGQPVGAMTVERIEETGLALKHGGEVVFVPVTRGKPIPRQEERGAPRPAASGSPGGSPGPALPGMGVPPPPTIWTPAPPG